MHHFLEFLRTDTTIALLVAVFIFIVTILLVVKRWIGFGMAFLFLLFSIGAGLSISSYQSIRCYLENCNSQPTTFQEQDALITMQMQQTLRELKIEIQTEKENLRRISNQVQEILDQLDYQRQKLHNFIEKTHNPLKENQTEQSTDIPENKKSVISPEDPESYLPHFLP